MKLKLDSIPENEATEQQKEDSAEDSLKVFTICTVTILMLLSNYELICALLA
jgi:hypothetical protein